MDDLFNMDFQISVPTDAVQQKILKTLYSPAKLALHDTHYSMLAFPFATRYQNSNQWVLEILTSALTGEQTRAAVQKDLASTGFKPSVIQISHFSKLGAHLFKANVSFDDHPAAEQHSNRFSIVSVDSVIRYLDDHHNLSLNKEYRKS